MGHSGGGRFDHLAFGAKGKMSEKMENGSQIYGAREAHQFLDHLGQTGRAKSVFTARVEANGYTIIQAAEVGLSGGVGFGGSVSSTDEHSEGGGGGGGGYAFGRPVASVIIGPDGVRVEPIVDVTKLGLTLFSAAAAVLLTLIRIRGKVKMAR